MQQSVPMSLNKHDLQVLGFHLLVVIIQAVLIQLGKENFGVYTPYVTMGVQVISEFVRRLVNG